MSALTLQHIRDMLLYIVAEHQKPSWIIPEVSWPANQPERS
jgi:hypothetical protein